MSGQRTCLAIFLSAARYDFVVLVDDHKLLQSLLRKLINSFVILNFRSLLDIVIHYNGVEHGVSEIGNLDYFPVSAVFTEQECSLYHHVKFKFGLKGKSYPLPKMVLRDGWINFRCLSK